MTIHEKHDPRMKYIPKLPLVAVATTLVITLPALAGDSGQTDVRGSSERLNQNNDSCAAYGNTQECLVLLLDHMERIKIQTPVSVVMIGNPSIADVTLLDSQVAFVSAKSIGATNMVALDAEGNEIVNYEIIVREPQVKRVSIRRAFTKENYQCAPDCNRALSMTDTSEEFTTASGVVSSRMDMSNASTATEPEVIQGINTQRPIIENEEILQ